MKKDIKKEQIELGRVLYPIESLGPGQRIGIWTLGCDKDCVNCLSPEYRYADHDKAMTAENYLLVIKYAFKDKKIDGITISGGEPFLQPIQELIRFIVGLREISDDILVYTGYTWGELQKKLSSEEIEILKKNISVLIDGRYIDELNDSKSALRGSTNQSIYYFDEKVREKYENYMIEGRKIQNVSYGEKILSIGIYNKVN